MTQVDSENHSTGPLRIGLLGISTSSRNQGVQALAASLANLFTRGADTVEITLFSGHSRPCGVTFDTDRGRIDVPVVNYRMSPASRPGEHLLFILAMSLAYRWLPFGCIRGRIARGVPWIGRLECCDLVADVRGGDSFSDIYGLKRYAIGFIAALTVLLVKGTMVQLPQTYGPFKSRAARWMARFLMKRSAMVIARDKTSQRVARELVGDAREIMLSPDVAFSMAARPPAELVIEPPLHEARPKTPIGINVNGLMYHGGYTRNNMFGLRMDYPGFLRALVLALLNEQSGDIWLVPHTYAAKGDVENDTEASHELRDSLPEDMRARVGIVAGEHDPHVAKGIIGLCGFFIGSRMHSCIAALSQGVPCAGVAYSMKFKGVFESVGMEDWVVDARECDDAEALRRVIDMYRGRDAKRVALAADAEAARDRLKQVFGKILALAAGRKASDAVRSADALGACKESKA